MKQKIKLYFLWFALAIIIIFMLQQIIPGFTELFVLNNKVFDGEIWRFVSAIFLHGSLTHLLYNLIALLFFGFLLEKLIGSKNFLLVFFASGIIANIIGINFYDSSLGASGAIYGILGCLTFIRPMMMVWAFGLLMPMFIASILWIVGDLLRIVGLFDPGNVGSIAHLSGIVVGFIIGIFLRGLKEKRIIKEKVDIPESYVKQWEDTYIRH